MKRNVLFLTCVLMLTLCAQVAFGGVFSRIAARRAGAEASQPQQRITELPNDANLPIATIMYHDDWVDRPEEVATIEKWQNDPMWAEIGRFHWKPYNESSAAYQDRLKADYPILPAIVVQKPDGQVVFKDHGGQELKVTNVSLAGSSCPDGSCTRSRRTIVPWNHDPQPDRSKNTSVSVVVEPPARPTVPDRVNAKKEDDAGPIVFGIIGVGLLASLVIGGGVWIAYIAKSAKAKIDAIGSE